MRPKILGVAVLCAMLTFVMATTNIVAAAGNVTLEYDVPDMPCGSRCYAGMEIDWDDNYDIYSFSHWADVQAGTAETYDIVSELYENNVDNAQVFIVVQYLPDPSHYYQFYAYVWCWAYPSYTPEPTHEEGNWQYGLLDS